MHSRILAAALLAAAVLFTAAPAEAAVATVDMRALFEGNDAWHTAAQAAGERRAALEREFDEKSEGLTGTALAALLQEYRQKARAAEREAMTEPYNRVLAVVEQVAREQGYDVVVRARSVLCGQADGDITEAVKARL